MSGVWALIILAAIIVAASLILDAIANAIQAACQLAEVILEEIELMKKDQPRNRRG